MIAIAQREPELISKDGYNGIPKDKLDLENILKVNLLVLNKGEKEVILGRFAIGQDRKTLQAIGDRRGVTRERIRQIEKIALRKLSRVMVNTQFIIISEIIKQVLNKYSGFLQEENLLNNVIDLTAENTVINRQIIKLVLHIDKTFSFVKANDNFKGFWKLTVIETSLIKDVCNSINMVLRNNADVLDKNVLIEKTQDKLSELGKVQTFDFIQSCLDIDKRFLHSEEKGWGLSSWRHINPKSLRDKAFIILEETNNPLHFSEIATAISEKKFDTKKVTVQATHNELIRDQKFVLVGRGVYALRKWGYSDGTVEEVIIDLFQKSKKNILTKKEIVKGILEQRQVQVGTISLNLQNCGEFVRVGRGQYKLDENLIPAKVKVKLENKK